MGNDTKVKSGNPNQTTVNLNMAPNPKRGHDLGTNKQPYKIYERKLEFE